MPLFKTCLHTYLKIELQISHAKSRIKSKYEWIAISIGATNVELLGSSPLLIPLFNCRQLDHIAINRSLTSPLTGRASKHFYYRRTWHERSRFLRITVNCLKRRNSSKRRDRLEHMQQQKGQGWRRLSRSPSTLRGRLLLLYTGTREFVLIIYIDFHIESIRSVYIRVIIY